MRYDLRSVLELIYGKELQLVCRKPLIHATSKQAAEVEVGLCNLIRELSTEFLDTIVTELTSQTPGVEVVPLKANKPEMILHHLLRRQIIEASSLGKIDQHDLLRREGNLVQAQPSKQLLRNMHDSIASLRQDKTISSELLKSMESLMKNLLVFAENLTAGDFFSKFIDPALTRQVHIVLHPSFESTAGRDPLEETKIAELVREWGDDVRNAVGLFSGCKKMTCLSLTECMSKSIPTEKMEKIGNDWSVTRGKKVTAFIKQHGLLYSSFLISFFSDSRRCLNDSKELLRQGRELKSMTEAKTKWANAIVDAGRCLETLLTLFYIVRREHPPPENLGLGELLSELEEDIKQFGRETFIDLDFVKEMRNQSAHYKLYGDMPGTAEIDEVRTFMSVSRVDMFLGIMKSYLRETIHENHREYLS